ncbi:hypothetical protein V8D89_006317 [Ganoderma adspersum]
MTVLFQNAFYVGNTFNGILYGVELMLCFLTAEAMTKKQGARRARSDFLFMAFNGASLLLNTIYVATEAVFGQEMWIEHASYSGGQNEYLRDHESVWYQTLGTSASIVLNLLSDALMIHRCSVIWGDIRAIVVPCILYLATLCLGVAQLVESGRPHSRYFSGVAHTLGVSYTASVIALELIVTTLICARILQVRQWHRSIPAAPLTGASTSTSTSALRESWARGVAGPYTDAVAIFVESALPSTLFGVAYLVTFALKSDVSVFFLSVYVMFTCISPQLIILRVMRGRAWTRHTTETIMSGAPGDNVYPHRIGIGMLSSVFTVGSESVASSHFCKECEGRYLHGRVVGPGTA